MRFRSKVFTLSLMLLASSLPIGVSPPVPQYFQLPSEDFYPKDIAAVDPNTVLLSIATRRSIGVFNVQQNSVSETRLDPGFVPDRIVSSGAKAVFLLLREKKFGVFWSLGSKPEYFDLPHFGEDLLPAAGGVWISVPDRGKLIFFSFMERTLKAYDVPVASGRSVMAHSTKGLWVVDNSYRKLLLFDPLSGRLVTHEFQEQVYLVSGAGADQVVVFGGSERLFKFDADVRLISTIELRKGAVISPPLINSPDGTIWYFDKSRSIIGELRGTLFQELPLFDSRPENPSFGAKSVIWFMDSKMGRLGRIIVSTAPALRNFSAGISGGSLELSLVVSDVDDDLVEESIVSSVELYREESLLQNSTVKLNRIPGGSYFAGVPFNHTSGVLRLRVIAWDSAGNVGSANMTYFVRDGSLRTVQKEEPDILQVLFLFLDPSLSLVLLLIIGLSVLVIRSRRRKTRRKK